MNKTSIAVFAAIALSACTTTQFDAFIKSPEGQAIEKAALDAATNALRQAAATGKVNGKEVLNAVGGGSKQLGTVKSTDRAADPTAITKAVKAGSANPAAVRVVSRVVAPKVAEAVAEAVQKKGISKDLANEAAARGLDKAVAQHK